VDDEGQTVRRVAGLALALAVAIVGSAHIGSPNVFFEGNAGAYPVRVIVRPPEVVPGLADVIVRVNSPDVKRVEIQPVFWRVGVRGAPAADEMHLVAGEKQTYTGQLWLMAYGAYSVYVTVDGPQGAGTAIVPVNSLATGRLPLSRGLGAILVVLGLLLFGGLVTIIRAASGESLIAPGEPLDSARRRRANIRAAIFAPILAVLVFGGAKWWNAEDSAYRRNMYGSPAADAAFDVSDGHRTLRLTVHDTAAFNSIYSPIVPDHGKMMHLFLVSEPGMEHFAHLHPSQPDSLVFVSEIPSLPAGKYRLFGDISMENGLSLSVTNTVTLPDAMGTVAPTDSDDVVTLASAATRIAPGAKHALGDGYTMEWNGASAFSAGRPIDLRFSVRDGRGAVASLDPYLGMAGHAVVIRGDGSVFIHLHPMGTVSMVGQEVFKARDRGDTTSRGRVRVDALPAMSMTGMHMSGEITFPYEFPKPGRYRIWVQVKPAGKVLTGVFDADVR
jgi:hypothetical protein